MRHALPVIIAAALSVACTGTPTPSSSSTAPSSEAVSSSVASSSSQAPISSSSVVRSSSSMPMSSSSQMVSSSSVPRSSSSQVASSSSSAPAMAKVIYAINVGSTESATYNGVTYEAESNFRVQTSGDVNGIASTTLGIDGTTEDKLFQSQRYGNYTFELPVTGGDYNVTLLIAEEYADMAGIRVMSATAEGAVILNNVDLYDAHNGRLKALTYTVNDVSVSDDNLTIDLSAVTNYATLSGILVTSVNGAKGEVVAPANPCDGTNNYVCLDFESELPFNYQLGSNAQITSTASKSGSKALRFYTDNKGAPYYGGYLKVPSVPGKHWGRLFYRIDAMNKLNEVSNTHIHTTFVAAFYGSQNQEVRLVDTVLDKNNGTHQYLYNFPDDSGGAASNYSWRFNSDWVCVEWSIDNSTQQYAFYREGTRVSEISRSFAGDHGGIPAMYSQMNFGGQVYQGNRDAKAGPEITGWLDDIVIGPARIGCN